LRSHEVQGTLERKSDEEEHKYASFGKWRRMQKVKQLVPVVFLYTVAAAE
jgi:hypothetical protein